LAPELRSVYSRHHVPKYVDRLAFMLFSRSTVLSQRTPEHCRMECSTPARIPTLADAHSRRHSPSSVVACAVGHWCLGAVARTAALPHIAHDPTTNLWV